MREEVHTEYNAENIIGRSSALQRLFKQIKKIAPYESTVLLQGETGTGKELVARAIHRNSNRKEKLLVKLNCAALPEQLMESELFGHEKGAFTGALSKRVGKFELAYKGTIFLDEIGEMPLELQSKLLRVIQEKEFERLGGNKVIKTDCRIIAASNRNLAQEILKGNFQEDLYYRLSVFPIVLPPLRDRKEDIPLLADFFGQQLAKKMGKRFEGLSANSLDTPMQYSWPGNIRELQNLIEQSIILHSKGKLGCTKR